MEVWFITISTNINILSFFFKLDILGIILCRTLAINVVCERSCKRYDAFQSLLTSVSYCDKFLHFNTSSQISTVGTGQFSQTFSTVWTRSGFLNRSCHLLLPFDAKCLMRWLLLMQAAPENWNENVHAYWKFQCGYKTFYSSMYSL